MVLQIVEAAHRSPFRSLPETLPPCSDSLHIGPSYRAHSWAACSPPASPHYPARVERIGAPPAPIGFEDYRLYVRRRRGELTSRKEGHAGSLIALADEHLRAHAPAEALELMSRRARASAQRRLPRWSWLTSILQMIWREPGCAEIRFSPSPCCSHGRERPRAPGRDMALKRCGKMGHNVELARELAARCQGECGGVRGRGHLIHSKRRKDSTSPW